MFQTVYDSPYHSPLLYWVLGGLFLLSLLRRLPFLSAFAALFTLDVLLDVLVTGAWSPLPPSPLASGLAVAFVLLGDLRFFLLYERFRLRPDGGPGLPPRALLLACAWTLLVPLLANLPRALSPALSAEPRKLFLLYELLFFALALALRLLLWPRRLRGAEPALRRWLLGLAAFQLVQYGAWAAADALILGGASAGYLLRLLPNALYYGAFLPYAHWSAPPALRGAS